MCKHHEPQTTIILIERPPNKPEERLIIQKCDRCYDTLGQAIRAALLIETHRQTRR